MINSDRELDLKHINLFLEGTINFTKSTILTASTGLSWLDYGVRDNLKTNNLEKIIHL
jgi:hypothetical protein